ncbi:MAG TPA: hypothetical protein PK205_18855, partial [Promineifilum sp.]|nr:hypothetical protein [Promineifilum sp.]
QHEPERLLPEQEFRVREECAADSHGSTQAAIATETAATACAGVFNLILVNGRDPLNFLHHEFGGLECVGFVVGVIVAGFEVLAVAPGFDAEFFPLFIADHVHPVVPILDGLDDLFGCHGLFSFAVKTTGAPEPEPLPGLTSLFPALRCFGLSTVRPFAVALAFRDRPDKGKSRAA